MIRRSCSSNGMAGQIEFKAANTSLLNSFVTATFVQINRLLSRSYQVGELGLASVKGCRHYFHLLFKKRIAVFWSKFWKELRQTIRGISSYNLLSDYYALWSGLSTLHPKTTKRCVTILFLTQFFKEETSNQNFNQLVSKYTTSKWLLVFHCMVSGSIFIIIPDRQNIAKLGKWKSKISTENSVKRNKSAFLVVESKGSIFFSEMNKGNDKFP